MAVVEEGFFMLNDPYIYLALQVFRQAFHDIRAYYTGQGRADEIAGGKDAVIWMREMKGTFRTCCLAIHELREIPVDKVHQQCLGIINQIKFDAFEQRFRNTITN